jgi:RNA polymerase sigma-70 factor (ECF subfamily)
MEHYSREASVRCTWRTRTLAGHWVALDPFNEFTAFVFTESSDIDLVQRLLRGDTGARNAMLERLQPTVRQRVSRVLVRQGSVSAYDANDLLQDVMILLLEKQERILGLWDPERGLSLDSFVGLVAQRTATTILRSGRKAGWAEHPTEGSALPVAIDLETPEHHIAQREELALIFARVRARLSARGVVLMEALLESPEAIELVRKRLQMSSAAVHSFRNRLRVLWRLESSAINDCKPDNVTADRI